MKLVTERIESHKRRLVHHRFFEWLKCDRGEPAESFRFAPVFVNFIMGFRDLNRWFLRYPEPQGRYEEVINGHTYEDAKHSRLFLEDWKKLGFDARLRWTPGDTVWWLFAAPETEVFRAFSMEIMQMAVVHTDPLVRFAFMEAIEACGHVFFGETVAVAAQVEAAHGEELRYFGAFHLAREMGHLVGAGDLFDEAVLDDAQRATAIAVVDRIFEMFHIECDTLLAFAERGARQGPEVRSEAVAQVSTPLRDEGRIIADPYPESDVRVAHPSQQRVIAHLERAKSRADGHPLFEWMESRDDGLTADQRLRRFVALWVPDILGYRDLAAYALTYRDPSTARHRAINRWTHQLTSHHALFMGDWAALDMDNRLGWTASETIEFYMLGPQSELQRRSMATFVDLAFRYPDPSLRYWLVRALEASGDAFFARTSRLAHAVEAVCGTRLDYLAARHELAHASLLPDPEAERVVFESESLSAVQVAAAIGFIDAVFSALETQFTLSLQLAQRNFFTLDPGRVMPPEVVALQAW